MSRSDSKSVMNQAKTNSTQDQAIGAAAAGRAATDIGTFRDRLNQWYANDPFNKGGQFEKDQNTIAANRASVLNRSLESSMASRAQRTGENTANYAPSLVKASQDSIRDQSAQQAEAEAQRLGAETQYQKEGLTASQFPAQAEENMFQTGTGAANNSLGVAERAAATPSFWDTFGQSFAGNFGKLLASGSGGSGGGPAYG